MPRGDKNFRQKEAAKARSLIFTGRLDFTAWAKVKTQCGKTVFFKLSIKHCEYVSLGACSDSSVNYLSALKHKQCGN